MFPHSGGESGPFGPHRLLHLPVHGILFPRRRPGAVHVLGRSLSPVASRSGNELGGGHLLFLLGGLVDHVSASVARLRADGSVWLLCGIERDRVGVHLPVRARDETTHAGGVGLCLCRAGSHPRSLSSHQGSPMVVQTVCSLSQRCQVGEVIPDRWGDGRGPATSEPTAGRLREYFGSL